MKGEGASRQAKTQGREPRRQCSLRDQTLEGRHRLRGEPGQGDLRQSALSLWTWAMEIQGGDSSWRGTSWSGTSHNFPWRPPWVCCLSRRRMSTGAPITSDLFSQKCSWICSVPSALSHWPPRLLICLQAVRQLAGRGGHCDHRTHSVDSSDGRTLGPLPCLPWGPS